MEGSQSRPALKTTALIRVVGIGSEALATARQIAHGLVAAIGDHGFVLRAGSAAHTAYREPATVGAVDAVVVIGSVRTLRIDVRSRRFRRDGRFRGIREIRSNGAGELETHHTVTSSKASRAVGCSAVTTQP